VWSPQVIERGLELDPFKDQASDRSLKAVLTARTVIMRDWAILYLVRKLPRAFHFAKLHRRRNGAP
jgi:hypothetical protein